MYRYLEGIKSPEDIKKLNIEELKDLSKDIRRFLVKNISKTGGHLASNLGVVELTLSLHKVFDSPKDKIIFDVGHQAYVHKMITGRKDRFDTLRQFGGLSGFPKESESEHDIFDTGHSSTSISAGLGIACARDIKGENFEVVSIIGDGAITGGMAIEALNNLGYLNKDMLVVFNDNEMSIDKNTGAFSSYMSKFMRSSDTMILKENIDRIMSLTTVGEKIQKRTNRLAETILSSVSPRECALIDSLGIKYYGPFDGHDIEELIDVFSYLKNISGPKFVHVKTVKGKGYRFAEASPELYHGVGKFDYRVGIESSNKKTISQLVGEKLSKMADTDGRIAAITAAMPTGTGLNVFEKIHPDRYFDIGIAEQHGVTFAAGLAKNGMKPYFAVYSTFLQRGYDQLIHDVCITKKPVTFLVDRAGLVGNDGETHHGIFDLAFLNPIPNIVVMSPKDTDELFDMLELSRRVPSPIAIRYPKGKEYRLSISDYKNLPENKNISVVPIDELSIGSYNVEYNNWSDDGKKILIIAIGDMVKNSIEALDIIYGRENLKIDGKESNKLKEKMFDRKRADIKEEDETKKTFEFMVVNARYLKPMNEDLYKKILEEADRVVTIENGVITGGLGSSIESIVCKNKLDKKIEKLGIPDEFVEHGDISDLLDVVGLSPQKIADMFIGII